MRWCPFCLVPYETDERVCPRDQALTVPAEDVARSRSLLGKVVGSYQVQQPLARGGMGEVYQAIHPAIGRRVAVKVLSPDLAHNDVLVDRFFAEARAINTIGHENIVEVIDLAFLPDGRPYLLMELLEGETLETKLRRVKFLMIPEVGPILLAVLDALEAAHAHGIIHRDLKPGNIFLARKRGKLLPKVLDFGIAKLVEQEPSSSRGHQATTTGSILGTPSYMAPEQAAGRVREIDRRSDLYSVGVMLYRALCGRVPFRAEAPGDLLMQILNDPPIAPRLLRPEVPPALDEFIVKSLAKQRGRRFQSASEMAGALHAALVASSVPASSLPAPVPAAAIAPIDIDVAETPVETHTAGEAAASTHETTSVQPPSLLGSAAEVVGSGTPPARGGARLGFVVGGVVALVTLVATAAYLAGARSIGDVADPTHGGAWAGAGARAGPGAGAAERLHLRDGAVQHLWRRHRGPGRGVRRDGPGGSDLRQHRPGVRRGHARVHGRLFVRGVGLHGPRDLRQRRARPRRGLRRDALHPR